ncbi:MAG TPA: hypothetical protein VGB53_17540 [Rubricoccaceae bacterium]|jgi:O-acetyl-ADP-ribose deacetylase (regulator of RNase III)
MASLDVVVANLTRLDVDEVVNAANERMLGGGGVDGAAFAVALASAPPAPPDV